MNRTIIDINTNKILYIPYSYPLYNQPIVYRPTYDTLVITSSDVYSDIYNNYRLYSLPIIKSYNNFFNVNDDPELRKNIHLYFYKKFKEIWMPFSYEKLYKYFTIEDEKVKFIKSLQDYKNNLITNKYEIQKFILKNIFGKHDILIFLDRFIKKNNLNWYDIKQNNQYEIKRGIYKKIKRGIEKIISKKKNL